jgi:membrane-associated protease RseP (regulator of RpoE activity)
MTVHAQLAERSKMPEMNFNFHGPNINVPVVRIPPINIPEIDVPNIVVVHAPRSSGMMIENLTPQLGEFFGVKGGNGVLVRSVEKGSRAEQAGIRAGDVIVKINGSAVNDCSDFSRLLRSRTSTKATVIVMRDRREQTVTLNLPEKRTGSIQSEDCEDLGVAVCAQIMAGTAEVAEAIPVITADIKKMQPDFEKMKKQIQKEVARQKPQMEKLQKEIQEQVRSHQGEIEKQMEDMRKDLQEQKEELRKEMQEWRKSADI